MLGFLMLVAFAIAVASAVVSFIYRDRKDIVVCIISIIFFVCSLFVVNKLINMTYEETLKTADWQLEALSDTSQITGHGSLFYLTLNTNEMYLFYYKGEDGRLKFGKIDANKSEICEGDYTPHIIRYTKYTRSQLNPRLRKILFGEDKSDDPYENIYEIYVPEGTLVRNFKIDLQ